MSISRHSTSSPIVNGFLRNALAPASSERDMSSGKPRSLATTTGTKHIVGSWRMRSQSS